MTPPRIAGGTSSSAGPHRRGSFAADQALLGDLAELQRQALDHRAKAADQAGEWAGDRAGELGVERLAAGQEGDRGEGVGIELLPVHQPALVVEQLPLGAQAPECLGCEGGVALDEGQGGRPAEMILEHVGPGGIGGAQGQAVLDDAEAGVGIAQACTQLGRLRHADPAVVHREDRRRVLELRSELLHHCCLLLFVHFDLILRRQRKDPHIGGPEPVGSRGPVGLSLTCAGLLDLGPADGLGRLFGSEECRGSDRAALARR